MRERARAVESAMVEIVSLCQGCLAAVFGDGVDFNGKIADGIPNGVEGIEAGQWNDAGDGARKEPPPVVKSFEKLSLLGS